MTKEQFKEKYKIHNTFCLNIYYRMWCIKNETGDGWSDAPSLAKLVKACSNSYFYYSHRAKRLIVRPNVLASYMEETEDEFIREIVVDILKE